MGLVAEDHVPLTEDEMLWQIRGLLAFCTSEATIATDQAVAVNLGGGNGPFCKIDTPIRELAEWAKKGIYAERMKREQSGGPSDAERTRMDKLFGAVVVELLQEHFMEARDLVLGVQVEIDSRDGVPLVRRIKNTAPQVDNVWAPRLHLDGGTGAEVQKSTDTEALPAAAVSDVGDAFNFWWTGQPDHEQWPESVRQLAWTVWKASASREEPEAGKGSGE